MKKLICKNCGNDKEFYTKERYKGTCYYRFRTDGEDAENGDMYVNANHSYRSKYIFCSECDAKVIKIEDADL